MIPSMINEATLAYIYTDAPSYVRVARSLELFRTLFARVDFVGARRRQSWDADPPEGISCHIWERPLGHGLSNLRMAGGLVRFIRERLLTLQPDVVVVVNDDMAALFAAGILPRPPVLVCDQFDSVALRMHGLKRHLAPLLRWISNATVRRMDALVEVSEERLGLYRTLPERTCIIPNAPVVPDTIVPETFPFPFVLVYGTLAEEYQPLRSILRAVEQIDGLRIVSCGKIVGEKIGDELRRHPRVTFVKRVPHTRALALVAGSSAVFCHQNPEMAVCRYGAPNKLFEAMAFGCPILMNSENGACRLAAEAGIGRFAAYGDVDAIRVSLEEILAGRWRPDERGEKSRRLFRSRYSWDLAAPRWVSLFRDLGLRTDCVPLPIRHEAVA